MRLLSSSHQRETLDQGDRRLRSALRRYVGTKSTRTLFYVDGWGYVSAHEPEEFNVMSEGMRIGKEANEDDPTIVRLVYLDFTARTIDTWTFQTTLPAVRVTLDSTRSAPDGDELRAIQDAQQWQGKPPNNGIARHS
ncbi:hypothetical protein E2P81_ATG08442 [Venturia nashicola]|nr:hypothetical protein E2P81_ATG08442 [Venturia nashicola]